MSRKCIILALILSFLLAGTSYAESYTPARIRAMIVQTAIKYHVPPEDALAVAHIESRLGKQEFRVGRMGRSVYYGPMGIHKCFLAKWRIDKPEVNIEVGVRALARYKDLKRALRRYNASFNGAYWRAIQEARIKYRRSLV